MNDNLGLLERNFNRDADSGGVSLRDSRVQYFWQDCLARKPFEVCGEREGVIIGGKCFHGGNAALSGILRYLFEALPKGVFLDLGSGSGENVIYAAQQGWRSFGIELSSPAYDFSLDNITLAESAGYIPAGLARIARGSFFPADFQVSRSALAGQDEFRKRLEALYDGAPCSDPYKELGIDLEEVDLFYHFQVERKDNIARLFSERARRGAKLLLVSTFRDTFSLPENLVLVDAFGPKKLYERA